ncbi:MAG: hypothetical protein ACP5I1_09830, partial [Candidatus Hinthialibacter sp.]
MMFSSLRQLKYPKEFRIAAPKWPKELLQNADQIVDLLFSPQEKDQEIEALVREIGTGLWRIRNRLLCEADPSLEIRGAMRFLESTWDALREAGVE